MRKRWSGWVVALSVGVGACGDPLEPEVDVGTWTDVVVGTAHACAVGPEGIACWGENAYGESGATELQDLPTPVWNQAGFSGSELVAGTSYTCGLPGNGLAWCRGLGRYGQLGWGLSISSAQAVPVLGDGWAQISAGRTHACGTRASGVWCWGFGGVGYSMGITIQPRDRCHDPALGTGPCVTDPTLVADTRNFRGVSAGRSHVCAIDASSNVHCWGENSTDQLGTGTADDCFVSDPTHVDFYVDCLTSPTPVALPGPVRSVGASISHSCALLVDGSVYCWGATAPFTHFGQLGHGSAAGSALPVRVAADVTFTSLAVGSTVCGLDDEGRAFCWGAGRVGALGVEDPPDECAIAGGIGCALSPVAVETEARFTAIGVGAEFTCGRTTDGEVLCWGLNESGQLGDGTTTSRAQPRPILAPVGGSR